MKIFISTPQLMNVLMARPIQGPCSILKRVERDLCLIYTVTPLGHKATTIKLEGAITR